MSLGFLEDELREVRRLGRHRVTRRFDSLGPRARLEGREVLVMCSNNYLGLAQHPRVVAAAQEAAASHGTGSTGSRLISGTTDLHEGLEGELAKLKGTDAALCFGTGYQASLGAITALFGKGDLILSDERNHASLIDACRLSRAQVRVYPHGDAQAAEAILRQERSAHRRALIVTDGVFSMDGDLAPLRELADLASSHDAALMVDDAHGTGVLGEDGSGTAHHLGVQDAVDLHMGTLSKALGSEGGFVAGSGLLREALVNLSRPFIFSTAPSPISVAAANEAVRVIGDEPDLRHKLHANARRMRKGLAQLGLEPPGVSASAAETPIIPVLLGEEAAAMAAMRALEQQGVYVAAIRPPTVPPGSCRLRVTVMATHTDDDIEQALAAFERVAPKTASRAAGVQVARDPEVTKVSQVTKVANVTKSTKVPKVTKVTKVPKVTKVTKVPKVTKVTKVPKVTKVTKPAKPAKISNMTRGR